MAEVLKGKQPVKDYKPSKLRHVEQVPGSDTIVPETQLEAANSHLKCQAEDEIYLEDLAFLDRNQIKRSADAPAPSQLLELPFLTKAFGISKPSSAITEPSFSFAVAKPITNKNYPEEDVGALQLSVHPDAVVSSIETTDTALKQDVCISPAVLPASPSPTVPESLAIKATKIDETRLIPNQSQNSSHTNAALVDVPHIEGIQSDIPMTETVTNPISQPGTQSAPIVKKSRSGTAEKKGKRRLLSRPLVPWPPRNSPVLVESTTPSVIDPSTQQTSLAHKSEASLHTYDVEGLAVNPCQENHRVKIDSLSSTGDQTPKAGMVSVDGTLGTTDTSNEHHVEGSSYSDSLEATQSCMPFNPVSQELDSSLDPSNIPEDRSSYASHEGYVRPKQMSQSSNVGEKTPDGAAYVYKPTIASPKTQSKLHLIQKVAPQHTHTDQLRNTPPYPEMAHNGLHELSSRSGPIRVDKVQRTARRTRNTYSTGSFSPKDDQTPSRMTALDIALDSFRTACLIDQDTMQDKMMSTVNVLKEENSQLRSTMLEQQTTIAELRVQLRTSKEDFARLAEKAKINQKYVAGLQSDYEKCQKSVIAFQKQNKQILQDQIAEVVKEKANLQGAFDLTIDSFAKARNKLIRTMEETYTQYVITVSANHDLRERLTEQVRMHDVEKNRRMELERELLPSVQNVQRQLGESSAVLIDKLSSIGTSLKVCVEGRRDDCSKDCLQILRKLESIPILTATDVRKAEGMLRFVCERTDAGFRLLAQMSESKDFSVDDIRQCMRDQIQGLQAEVLRHNQAIADDRLAHKTSESLRMELVTQKQSYQLLEQQVNMLQQSEVTLKECVMQLEEEKDKLQAAAREHETQLQESVLKVTQFQEQLAQAKDALLPVSEVAEQSERLRLEQEQAFHKYELDAKAQLTGLREQVQQMTDQTQNKEREYDALRQDAENLKNKLESMQSGHHQLAIEISQHRSTIEMLRQEKNSLTEKYGISQTLLSSKKEEKLALEAEKDAISTALEEACMDLRKSKDVEARLTAQCLDLQKQLNKLQEAKDANDEQVQQAQYDMIKLQQTKEGYTAEIEDLRFRLRLSEHAQEEPQAKMQQMEAAHRQELKCHQQTAEAKIEGLNLEAQRQREQLDAQRLQELERQQQEFDTRIEQLRQDSERQIEKLRSGPTAKTLIPNSQSSLTHDATSTASQQSQTRRTRKKIDRQKNSMMVVIPSNTQRLNTDPRESPADRSSLPHSRREDSQHQIDYFEEDLQRNTRSQTPFYGYESNVPLVNFDTELVSETQEFAFAEGFTAQFDVIESQLSVSGSVNQDETMSDLSTMPSEDLSEMLLDVRSDPERGCSSSRPLSPKDMMQTPGQSGQDLTSDVVSTSSQGRPKSRANTAFRMTPLAASDVQRQRKQVHDGARYSIYARPDQISRANNNNSRESTYVGKAVSKPTCAQITSMHNGTGAGDINPGRKRRSIGNVEQDNPFKKTCTSVERPTSASKSSPYTSVPEGVTSHPDATLTPSSVTGRRSSNRQSSNAGSQIANSRLSSARNTRSKTNRYADRFGQELDRR